MLAEGINTCAPRRVVRGAERPLPMVGSQGIFLNLLLVGLVFGALPVSAYFTVWVCAASLAVQSLNLRGQLRRGNFLCAAVGFCLTAMLLMGLLIPRMWQPADMNGYFNPAFLSPSLTGLANRILLLSGNLYYVIIILLAPRSVWKWKAPDIGERSAARLVVGPALLSGIILSFLTRQGGLITSVAYPYNSHADPGVLSSISGLELLAPFLLSFAIVAACRAYGFSTWRFRWTVAAALAAVVYFSLLRGNRAGIVFVVTTTLFLFYLCSKTSRLKKSLVLVVTALSTFALLQVWASARNTAASTGLWPAMVEGWHSTIEPMTKHFDPLQVQMLPQSYWHLLDVEYLVENGGSAHGATVYGLFAQSVPGFVARAIHFERPINSAWLIGRYGLTSGGGMYVIAEGYWNFGMLGALGMAVALALIAAGFERWLRRQEPLMACVYFAFLGSLGFGMFYGLQPFARALEIAVALAIFARVAMSFYRRSLEFKLSSIRRRQFLSRGLPSKGLRSVSEKSET